MYKTEEIRIRDPYVVVKDGAYYMYRSVSESGSILGEWKHIEKPIFNGNGGHAMFFDTVDGRLMMCIHCPERPPEERATFIEAFDEGGRIRLERDK